MYVQSVLKYIGILTKKQIKQAFMYLPLILRKEYWSFFKKQKMEFDLQFLP